MFGVYKFKEVTRVFVMRHGKLFTKRSDGPEAEAFYAGQDRFFYGPADLSWFKIGKDAQGRFVFERHADGADEIDVGVRVPAPARPS